MTRPVTATIEKTINELYEYGTDWQTPAVPA